MHFPRACLMHLALAFTLATVLGAAAPPPDTAPVKDWSNVEVVVVRPDHPGPAMWHVVKGDSEVWILPTVSPVPDDLTWDSSEVAAVLKGANALLLPPRARLNLAEGLWFYMWHMDTLEQPDGRKLESAMPEALRARFVARRTQIGRDADRYEDYLGGVAAVMLENDYFKWARMKTNALQRTVEQLASRAGVQAKATANYPAMDVIHDVPKMSAAAHQACLQFALSDIDTASAHAALAARAWARGDVAETKAHYLETRLDDCLQASDAYVRLRENANRDMTNAVLAALKKPGKAVAVMPMGFFLRKGGVLERLQGAGLTVTGPGS